MQSGVLWAGAGLKFQASQCLSLQYTDKSVKPKTRKESESWDHQWKDEWSTNYNTNKPAEHNPLEVEGIQFICQYMVVFYALLMAIGFHIQSGSVILC